MSSNVKQNVLNKLINIVNNCNLLIPILTEWLTYRDFANFDVALCSRQYRSQFMLTIQRVEVIFGQYDLDFHHEYAISRSYYNEQDLSFLKTIPRDHPKWNRFLNIKFMTWLVERNIYITGTFIIPKQLHIEKDMTNFRILLKKSGKLLTKIYFTNFWDTESCKSILNIISVYCTNLLHLDCWEYGPWESNPRSEHLALRRNIKTNFLIYLFANLAKDGKFSKLLYLNITGCDAITETTIYDLVENCSSLKTLYLGFCISITNATILKMTELCPTINSLSLYGNNRIPLEQDAEMRRVTSKLSYFKLNSPSSF
jgi:hypothetical protein